MLALNQYDHLTLANIEKFSEESESYVIWKDRNYHYLGANTRADEFTRLPLNDFIGLTDQDMNWLPGGHSAAYFNAIDDQVIKGQRVMTNEKEITIKANPQGEIITRVVVASKRPILHNGFCLGVVIQAIDITQTLFPTLSSPKGISNEKNLFAPRELDCIELLLFGYSYKCIANKLGLSTRTVEYYIENIKRKLNCTNKQMLIEKLLQLGYTPNYH